MALNNNVVPSKNFIENLHYMDCGKSTDGLIRIFFKAIPDHLLGARDLNPKVEFVCALTLDENHKPNKPFDEETQKAFEERTLNYFNTVVVNARAVGVAYNDLKRIK